MAQAQEYKRKKNFAENNPDQTDLAALDNELDNVSIAVNTTIKNLALIQKDDGTLANQVVGPDNVTDEFMETIKGADGAQGPEGPEGPQGEPGDMGPVGPAGASFAVAVTGLKSELASHNNEKKGYSFLAMDEGKLYLKLSDAEADWSQGYPFGKGAQGPEGPRGLRGPRGLKGETGATGPQGEKGEPGIPGKDGANGKDAVVSSVSTSRSSTSIVGKRNISVGLVITGGVLSITIDASA